MTAEELVRISKSKDFMSLLGKINRWDLLPALFRVKGKPFSLDGRDQFSVLFSPEIVRETIVMSGRQLGKCGRCTLKEDPLALRDNLGRRLDTTFDNPLISNVASEAGSRHKTGKVAIYMSPGVKPILRIRTSMGRTLQVTAEHKVRTFDGYLPAGSLHIGSRVMTLRKCYSFGKMHESEYRIALTAYLIGDGTCATSRSNLEITGAKEVTDHVRRLCSDAELRITKYDKNPCISHLVFRSCAKIREYLAEDGILNKYSYEKSIPDWVFELDRGCARLFVECLWATDGSVKRYGDGFASIDYCSTSPLLASDLRALLSKFGIATHMRVKKCGYRGKDGVYRRCRDAYIIRVYGYKSQKTFLETFNVPGKPSFEMPASRSGQDDRSNRDTLLNEFMDGDVIYDKVVSIESIGSYPTYDLEVEGYHNFILDNVCVHNSMSLSRSEGYDLASVDNLQILYVAPLQEQTRRYSDLYFSEAIRSCPLLQTLQKPAMLNILDSDSKIIKATGHQSFANGAGIQFTYAKDSGDRIRGVMADRIDFDEVQDQSADVIPIVQESLTSSEWGCSRYTGTAKVEENLIEAKWRQSSMCEWVMKCEHCGTWAIPNLDGDVLKMIQADGIHCLHCGSRLNVLNGQWIAAFPDRMNSFRGYHIPQVICPFIVNNKNNWDKLLHKLLNGVLSTFIQENLGISYSVGQRLITMKHLQRQCLLPSARTLQEEIRRNPARYTYIVAGVDWGGAELSSFTVLTIIGIRPNGRIDVLWAERFRGFDPDEQMKAIAQACVYYGVTAIGADIGMGLDKNIILAKRFGLPVVQIQYTRQLKLFGKNQSKGRTNTVQCWTIDKVMALDVLFLAIRNRRIFFPKDEAFKSKFLPDILSPYETTTESGGITHRLYLRSESQPDDFCHALCFASMVAMKLLGMAVDDMIPPEAFGGGMIEDEAPNSFGVGTKEE